MRLPLMLALVAVAAGPAAAQAPTGGSHTATVGELATLCAVPAGDPSFAHANGLCRGFIAGFAQYHAAMTQPGTRHRPLFCVPDPAPSSEQAAAAFAAWARGNPQTANELAVDGLARWFIATYPCPAAPARRPAAR
ncbi:Rap1a/Tai family immunity protein [Roseomonas rosulenta]|uniref:Rap1a/Tai family immunity protein n=1 Tax=Roseomonas rosulenta TaxID=2748667 RepID=UPI0018E02C4C|nr:Rap1a/Tai family immunity protein [Roseomonas rosulenta]